MKDCIFHDFRLLLEKNLCVTLTDVPRLPKLNDNLYVKRLRMNFYSFVGSRMCVLNLKSIVKRLREF